MSKKFISRSSSKELVTSLSLEDFEALSDLASYLLSIKADRQVSPIGEDYFINAEPIAFSVEDLALLKKLKHLHVLSILK